MYYYITENLRINAVLKLKSKVGPEATYLEVVGMSSNHSYDGRIQYNLTNLIKGSPETSKSYFLLTSIIGTFNTNHLERYLTINPMQSFYNVININSPSLVIQTEETSYMEMNRSSSSNYLKI